MKKIPVVLFAVALLGFVAYQLHAQSTPKGFLVTPSNFELSITQGQTVTKTVRFINQSTNDTSVTVDTRNFTAQGEEGSINLTEDDTTYSLAKWITVTPPEFSVPAGKTKEVTFTLTVPENAEAGGHFGSLIFSTGGKTNPNDSGAAVAQEIASLILVKVPGDVVEDASVESFKTNSMFYEFGPVEFSTRVKNNGGVHIKPTGDILITDMFGHKMTVPFNGSNVLPGAGRHMTTNWDSHFLIGKYTAEMITAYGAENKNLYATTEFYAFPVRYGLVGLAIIALLFLFRKRLGKSIKVLISGK